jgi:hypothetical protein
LTDDWIATGNLDRQTVDRDCNVVGQRHIDGVACSPQIPPSLP